jgi:hypothetical protein
MVMNSVVNGDIFRQCKRPVTPIYSPERQMRLIASLSLYSCVYAWNGHRKLCESLRRLIWVWLQVRADLSSSPLCQRLLCLLSLLSSRTNWIFSKEKMDTAWSLQLAFILCLVVVCVEVSFKSSYVPTPCMVLGQHFTFRCLRKILKSYLASSNLSVLCLSLLLSLRMQQLSNQ